MAKKSTETIKKKSIRAALDLAVAKGWADVSLRDIADKAGIGLNELREYFDDKTDILAAYGKMIDRRVLEAHKEIEQSLPPRDRLFDILMERFDIINEDKEAVCVILSAFCFDPKQAVISLPHLGRSMTWMLEAAGIETGGYRGAVKVLGLTAIYLKTLRSWKDDESPDMAKTMAALDRNLEMAERWAGRFGL